MKHTSNFSQFTDSQINRFIKQLSPDAFIQQKDHFCTDRDTAFLLLASEQITSNIGFGKKYLSTTIYGDNYSVKRTENLCRDIAELYLVNLTANEVPK